MNTEQAKAVSLELHCAALFMVYTLLPGNVFSFRCIHPIEKTLSGEKHKPSKMRPKGFLGRCISSFAYSKFKPVLL